MFSRLWNKRIVASLILGEGEDRHEDAIPRRSRDRRLFSGISRNVFMETWGNCCLRVTEVIQRRMTLFSRRWMVIFEEYLFIERTGDSTFIERTKWKYAEYEFFQCRVFEEHAPEQLEKTHRGWISKLDYYFENSKIYRSLICLSKSKEKRRKAIRLISRLNIHSVFVIEAGGLSVRSIPDSYREYNKSLDPVSWNEQVFRIVLKLLT